MSPKRKDALEILRDLEGDDPELQAILREERFNLQLAQMVYDARTAAGLTQPQLANQVGISRRAIEELEEADHEGLSVALLVRIGEALRQRLEVRFAPRNSETKAA